MSHFAVAVLSDGTKTLEELLAPYQEDDGETIPRGLLEFRDTEVDSRELWESGTREMVWMDGRLYPPYDKAFRRPGASKFGFCSADYEIPEGLSRVEIPLRALYPDFDVFMRDYRCEERDAETGRYGYWENPNAKWDWWVVGGRWERWAEETIGGVSVRVGDIRFDPEAEREKAARWWDENVEAEGPDFVAMMVAKDLTREQYVECRSHLSFRAVVTPDGEWHEVGSMGWWGISSETAEDLVRWDESFEGTFLKDADLTLTVVGCHI